MKYLFNISQGYAVEADSLAEAEALLNEKEKAYRGGYRELTYVGEYEGESNE